MIDFELVGTGERRPQRVDVNLSLSEVEPPPEYNGIDMFQERFSLRLTIGTDFWSNRAQLDAKRVMALRVVCAHLFKDMIPLIDEIICDADDEGVRANAMSLKDMMIPK